MRKAISGIYIIVNTVNGKVYVGQAIDIHTRWYKHKRLLNARKHDNRHLQSAWNKNGPKSFKFLVVEYCNADQLNTREQHYLDIYINKGNCYNIVRDVTAPGRGLSPSLETRQKISKAIQGRKHSNETRLKISESNKGRVVTDETRHKISRTQKGRIFTDETRRKLSEARRKRSIPDETCRKISEASKGHIVTDETRRKLSEANSGKNNPNYGKVTSDETRRKQSESQKRRRALEKILSSGNPRSEE